MKLAYGDSFIEIDLSSFKNVNIVKPASAIEQYGDSGDLVRKALVEPVGSPTLYEIASRKGSKNALIIVNDITRPTPYRYMLPPLTNQLNEAGIEDNAITLLVATGIHRPNTLKDSLYCFGEEACQRFSIINHDCDNNLTSIGTMENGMELCINKLAVEADLLICTGLVSLHYIAGYSGGRKSILPGIAARPAIEASHKLMSQPRACLGNIRDNPVNDLMLKAAEMAGVDFVLNVVGTQEKILYAAAGHYEEAWMAAVEFCEKSSIVSIKEKADVVIASCGGYPKDINVYQAQKALDTAALAVKPMGTIILVAECREGLGEEIFSEWIKAASCPADINERFHRQFELGGHKAFAICRILEYADIDMVSSMTPNQIEEMFIRPVGSIEEALNNARKRYGNDMTVIVMPEAPKTAVQIDR